MQGERNSHPHSFFLPGQDLITEETFPSLKAETEGVRDTWDNREHETVAKSVTTSSVSISQLVDRFDTRTFPSQVLTVTEERHIDRRTRREAQNDEAGKGNETKERFHVRFNSFCCHQLISHLFFIPFPLLSSSICLSSLDLEEKRRRRNRCGRKRQKENNTRDRNEQLQTLLQSSQIPFPGGRRRRRKRKRSRAWRSEIWMVAKSVDDDRERKGNRDRNSMEHKKSQDCKNNKARERETRTFFPTRTIVIAF